MKTAEANGTIVAYEDHGAGEPLLLLHGGEGGRHMFDSFIPLLGDGIRALPYDQRDTGGTRNSASAYTIKDLAADCAALIEALGLDSAHIMGVSYGSAIALNTAIEHPARVKSLILGASAPSWRDVAANQREKAAAMLAQGPEGRDQFMLDIMLSPGYASDFPEVAAQLRSVLVTRPPDGAARRYQAIEGHDCVARLGEIKAPTLIVHGSDDPITVLAGAEAMAAAIQDSELVILPGLRHGLTFQEPELAARAIRKFVLRPT